jgi:hypothetical protein
MMTLAIPLIRFPSSQFVAPIICSSPALADRALIALLPSLKLGSRDAPVLGNVLKRRSYLFLWMQARARGKPLVRR